MSTFLKIHHFAIQVHDIDKSIKFYTEKLGFKIKTPKASEKNYFYTNLVLDDEGAEIELIEIQDESAEKKEASRPKICPHIALESFDFDKDLKTLKEKGVKIFDGPHTIARDVKIVTILDPDGYRIDIGQLINNQAHTSEKTT